MLIHLKSSDATHFNSADEAFSAWVGATAEYPDWSFRVRSGANPGQYRIEAWKIAGTSSGWLMEDDPEGCEPPRLDEADSYAAYRMDAADVGAA